MPPLAELSREGYAGLFNACSRFRKLPCYSDIGEEEEEEISGGGLCEEEIHQAAGLVPFQEWRWVCIVRLALLRNHSFSRGFPLKVLRKPAAIFCRAAAIPEKTPQQFGSVLP